jgi:transcription elongation factor GreA
MVKERQSFIEGRISEIEDRLARADVIDPASLKSDRIVFGATVVLSDEGGTERTYQIVGEEEADIKDNRISIFSPIAKALIGKEVGDTVDVRAPRGIIQYEVLEIRFG